MGNIFTRKALNDIMANDGLTSEQRTEQVMSLYGRALDDGYISKSAAQTAQETALNNAKTEWEKNQVKPDVKESDEYKALQGEYAAYRTMQSARSSEDFKEVKPKFFETVYGMIERGDFDLDDIIANTIGAAGVGYQTTEAFGNEWFGLVSAITTVLILVFSEIIPKTIGTSQWRRLMGFTAYTIRTLIFILYPIVVAVSVITTFLTPYIMKLAYPTLAFLEKHMSNSTKMMLDSYVEKRQSGTNMKQKRPLWIVQIDRLVKFLLLKIAMAPGINKLLRVFNENLYARERLAESQRGLEREVENSLISLEMNIAEVDVPNNSAFAGRALKDLNIRNITGANIVRIIRGGININIPGGNHRLYPGDRIILAGSDTDVAAFQKMLETSLAPTEKDLDSLSTNIVLDNFTITADSPLCGKSIIKSGIREKGNCIVMGLVRPSEDFYTNPDPSLVIQAEDIIIVAGEKQKMQDFFAQAAISNPKIWS